MLNGMAVVAAVILGMFCAINSARAKDIPLPSTDYKETSPELGEVVLAGGCFWCTEAVFQSVKGVEGATSGYIGGSADTATYEQVGKGDTGHAEAIKIIYNPAVINLGKILQIFFSIAHDPTQVNRQGHDVGTQYRSAVFVKDDAQREYVAKYIAELTAAKAFDKPIATKIEPLTSFYEAEKYHQNYAEQNPENGYIQAVAAPKVEKLKTTYPELDKSKVKDDVATDIFADPKSQLTKMQCHVTQEDGTEPAFDNAYWNNHEDGIYVDVISGEPLFSSADKFDSGSGWPSFTKPIEKAKIVEKQDNRYGMSRVEVRSSKANSHLGHLFEDGPKDKGGLRYCINSASLRFIPKADLEKEGYDAYLALFQK